VGRVRLHAGQGTTAKIFVDERGRSGTDRKSFTNTTTLKRRAGRQRRGTTPGGKKKNGPNAGPARLLADSELLNHSLVALGVILLEVVEQTTTSADHHEKAATRRMVLLVRLEMLGQLANALAEQSNLDLGTAGVGRVGAIAADNRLFPLSR
jgi:hypothetical protein